jgi:hypothetical protein
VPELELMLRRLGRELDYPATPNLAAAVTARLREAGTERVPTAPALPGEAPPGAAELPTPPPVAPAEPPERAAPPARPRLRARLPRLLPPAGLRRSLALALIALLLLAGTVFAAVPGVRDAVLEFLGLRGATVERREKLPELPELRPLQLGQRVPLAEASKSLAFAPLIPDALGPPDATYVRRGIPGGELSLTYRPRPGLPQALTTKLGLLVGEFRGDLLPEYTGKIAGQATRIERLEVDGSRAIWIEGAPHLFFYRAPGRPFVERDLRLAANVLLVERGNVLVRLEGAFGRERAVAIARSLR